MTAKEPLGLAPDGRILPIIMNLANISPNQRWAGAEHKALDARKKPDLVFCFALIHQMRLGANVLKRLFLRWLRTLDAEIVIEFVDRHYEMVIKLLTNKKEQHFDYSRESFVAEVGEFFDVLSERELKGAKRVMYHLKPR